jgi:ATP-dependent helicase/nuclease subunit A
MGLPHSQASKITPRGRRDGRFCSAGPLSPRSRSTPSLRSLAWKRLSICELTRPFEVIERGDFERPSGRRFGALVHALLASIDLNAGADAIQASAAINGRLVGAIEEEIKAAIVTVCAALRHPILQRAAASAKKGELRRETPVLLALDDGSLVEGVVDLAFREDTPDYIGWTVLDFKTDREFATSSDRYTAQVSFYSEAIRAATGLLSQGIVLVV